MAAKRVPPLAPATPAVAFDSLGFAKSAWLLNISLRETLPLTVTSDQRRQGFHN